VIEIHCRIKLIHVLLREKVVIGANNGIVTTALSLQPCRVFRVGTAGGRCDNADGNELEAIQWSLNASPIGQCLGSKYSSNWRIEPLQEPGCRVLENRINGGLDVQLGILGKVGADAEDLRGGIGFDVSASVEFSGGVDLIVSKVCQGSGREVLGCTVSMAMENVDAEDGLLRMDEWQQGRNEEDVFGKHLNLVSLIRNGSMNENRNIKAIKGTDAQNPAEQNDQRESAGIPKGKGTHLLFILSNSELVSSRLHLHNLISRAVQASISGCEQSLATNNVCLLDVRANLPLG
jgi:hypothetical protein